MVKDDDHGVGPESKSEDKLQKQSEWGPDGDEHITADQLFVNVAAVYNLVKS